MEADADAEEGFSGCDVFSDGGEIASRRERIQAMAEVADAGEDDFLCSSRVVRDQDSRLAALERKSAGICRANSDED